MTKNLFESREFGSTVFAIGSTDQFNALSLELFHYQYKNNEIYGQYVDLLNLSDMKPVSCFQLPFLPIRFFKSAEIITGNWDTGAAKVFTSSGTTGTQTSRHFVKEISLYEASFLKCFEKFYGSPEDYVILALLPSYLERGNSSLVFMAERLIHLSGNADSGFFLDDFDKLHAVLLKSEKKKQRVLLLGVSFALLDFAGRYKMKLNHTIVMETGGMKGRKKEITRSELHQLLKEAFGVSQIHSEYGMTELLSQAYSKGEGKYFTPPWMKVVITSLTDPRQIEKTGTTGRINIIDLANVHSCAFIATDDLGKINEDGSFEVIGRFDNSDLRGCNLLL